MFEMVIDVECDYFWEVYVSDCCVCLNFGIWCWFVLLFECDCCCVELMNSLLFFMFGMFVMYYGDEIGMGDNIYLGDCDGVCMLMQWFLDCNGGFLCVDLEQFVLLVIMGLLYGYELVNVEV